MWLSIIFAIGIIGFLSFVYFAKLYRFHGTKLKTRMNYALALSLFFLLLFLYQTEGQLQIIGKGFLLGVALSIPFCFYSKRWIDKKIEGSTIFYKNRQYVRSFLWGILIFILFQIFVHQEFGRQIIEDIWPILGLSFSWFVSQVFILFYIVKRERILGRPILEEKRGG